MLTTSYELVAKAIKDSRPALVDREARAMWRATLLDLAKALRVQAPEFPRREFLEACGY